MFKDVVIIYLKVLSHNLAGGCEKAVRTPAGLRAATGDRNSTKCAHISFPHPTCPVRFLGILKDGILREEKEVGGGSKRLYI
jgi:hypothetical protein